MTGKHYFSYVHDDIKLITNESFGLRVVLDQTSGSMLLLAQGKWEETVTTGILCHSTSYHRYPLTTNNCLSEVFPKSLTPLNTPMVDICISSPLPPPPQLAYNVCPFGKGWGGGGDCIPPTEKLDLISISQRSPGIGKKLMIQKNVYKLWFF